LRRIDISGVLLLWVLVFVLKVGTSFASADGNFLFQVRKINFVGVEAVSKKDLAESLAAKVPPFWEFWKPYPDIRILDLEDDILRVKQFYQAQGFYQATAEYTIQPVDPQESFGEQVDAGETSPPPAEKSNALKNDLLSKYDITFQINEGLPVIIRDISINCLCGGLESVSAAQIREILELKPGNIFKTKSYDHSKTLVRKLLGNRGYPFAKVRGSATVDLNDNSANITFDIDPDKLYNFGDIHIAGHEDYVREEVIRRAVIFKSGEKFAVKDIDESRRNLFDLNIFKTAVIKPGDPNTENKTLPVDIIVKPRKKRSVKLGIGYGTDDGLRLQAALSYRNLTGRADRLTLRARRSDIVEGVYAEYFLPYFLSARNNLVSTAGFEREEKDYYTLQRTSTEVNFYRKLEAHWFTTIGYNLESNQPDDIHMEDSESLIDIRDTENYLVSSVKFNLERNTVDDVLNSRKGTAVGFSIEHASDYLGSEISYIRPGIDVRCFIPLPWDLVLAGRMNFKTIQESGDTDYIPISRNFFLGGSKSVRGYGFEKLGVIDKDDVIVDISGLSSFIANLELRFPIYKDFGGVVFMDAGALYENSFNFDANSLRYTSGLGLRYNTIIGPIQLDFGYQLNPAKSTVSDDPLLTDLLNKDRWYLHFNIGQAF